MLIWTLISSSYFCWNHIHIQTKYKGNTLHGNDLAIELTAKMLISSLLVDEMANWSAKVIRVLINLWHVQQTSNIITHDLQR